MVSIFSFARRNWEQSLGNSLYKVFLHQQKTIVFGCGSLKFIQQVMKVRHLFSVLSAHTHSLRGRLERMKEEKVNRTTCLAVFSCIRRTTRSAWQTFGQREREREREKRPDLDWTHKKIIKNKLFVISKTQTKHVFWENNWIFVWNLIENPNRMDHHNRHYRQHVKSSRSSVDRCGGKWRTQQKNTDWPQMGVLLRLV